MSLEKGKIITLKGMYRRRTFWEWITFRPKQLQKFYVAEDVKK